VGAGGDEIIKKFQRNLKGDMWGYPQENYGKLYSHLI